VDRRDRIDRRGDVPHRVLEFLEDGLFVHDRSCAKVRPEWRGIGPDATAFVDKAENECDLA
jgi:hypothetical protein